MESGFGDCPDSMRHKPPLSILIPWYERDELGRTLAANAPVFRAHQAEILILNCGGSGDRLQGLIAASEAPGVRQLNLSVPRFNKSLALNAGLANARADKIFILDADIILLDPLPMEALDEHSFITIESVYESAPRDVRKARADCAAESRGNAALEFRFRDGVKVRHQLGLRDALGNVRAGTGLLLSKKEDLLNIGGYNSDLDSWGWEDDDVLVRLQYALKRRRIQSGAVLHLTHGDSRRFLQVSRGQSDQRNFIKCCRNYNNGLILGSYQSDIVSLRNLVTETLVGPAAPEMHGRKHDLSSVHGPMYCGRDDRIMNASRRDRSEWPPPISALLLEAALAKSPVENCNVLQVETDSRLTAKLSPLCRHVTGVVRDETKRSTAISARLPNYEALIANPYSQTFRESLPLRAYDVIIDCNMASTACCRRHLLMLMENYSSLLAPGGWLATAEPGIDGAASNNLWKLSATDLAMLADQFGLAVSKAGLGVYKLTRRDFRL